MTMLRAPGGHYVRCTANKRYAIAVAAVGETHPNGDPKLKVLFRSNDRVAVGNRMTREAKRLGRPALLFNLVTGAYVGARMPDGTSRIAPVTEHNPYSPDALIGGPREGTA